MPANNITTWMQCQVWGIESVEKQNTIFKSIQNETLFLNNKN
jgi:hypothetical protein